MAVPHSGIGRLYYRAAGERFEEAGLLLQHGRTTGAVYLAGYSVECILKALVLAVVPRSQEPEVLTSFRGTRAHDYEWLKRLYLEMGGARIPKLLLPHFTRVNTWSTDLRYSPALVKEREAMAFLDSVSQIIRWADGRL